MGPIGDRETPINLLEGRWPMNDDRFSLKARRTTRIPLRIPVQLVIQEAGQTRTFDGWTMIVNVQGARIESKSKRPFALNEEVLLQVPSNGKAQKGRVVWSGPEANSTPRFSSPIMYSR